MQVKSCNSPGRSVHLLHFVHKQNDIKIGIVIIKTKKSCRMKEKHIAFFHNTTALLHSEAGLVLPKFRSKHLCITMHGCLLSGNVFSQEELKDIL